MAMRSTTRTITYVVLQYRVYARETHLEFIGVDVSAVLVYDTMRYCSYHCTMRWQLCHCF
jgi:hypothetical protein